MAENETLERQGFVAMTFDVPFAVSLPNGAYLTRDPEKGLACIELVLREGSLAFFRNRPIIGPTSFKDLQTAAQNFTRPRPDYSYVVTSVLADGGEKATLNIHCGEDGGFAECKYFSCVTVTFLADDLRIISESDRVKQRVTGILAPFLDKYRVLSEDYKVARLPSDVTFYLASYHTSPLRDVELNMDSSELFKLLAEPRAWRTALGSGATNNLRANSYESVGPRSPMAGDILREFISLTIEDYSMPLSYEFVLEALRCLQKAREFRLAIVHAETAIEVYVSDTLVKLMRQSGMSESDARSAVESDKKYWGIKKRLRRLDEWTEEYCHRMQLPFVPFVASSLFGRWDSKLYANRNRAIHEGAGKFQYQDAWEAIGIAKECIVLLEQRIPGIAHWVSLNTSMSHLRESAGEVSF